MLGATMKSFQTWQVLVYLGVCACCAADRETDDDEKDEFGVPYCADVTPGFP